MTDRSVVIFDLDGTLTRPYLDFDAIRAEIGVEGPILEALEGLDEQGRRRAEEVVLRHEREAAQNATLHDGVFEVLAGCRARGHRVAILTRNSRESCRLVLTIHKVTVDAVRTREDGAIKPSAEPVLSICRELSANPRHSWMVGDHLFDIVSGEAAGTRTVLMVADRPLPEFADRADYVIRSLPELLEILDAGPPAGDNTQ